MTLKSFLHHDAIKRTLVTLLVLPPLGIILTFSPYQYIIFHVLLGFCGLMMAFELMSITRANSFMTHPVPVILFSQSMLWMQYLSYSNIVSGNSILFFPLVCVMYLMISHFCCQNFKQCMESIAIHALWCCVLGYGLVSISFLHHHWRTDFFWLMLIVWCSDIFGYFGGKIFGNHKLTFLTVSPNKTLEGYVFGLLGPIIVSQITLCLFDNVYSLERLWIYNPKLNVPIVLSISALASCGDLMESLCKRWGTVKDSHNYIPGHGGFLDVLDSLLLVSIVAYCIIHMG